jgi:hypothetical protein
VLKTLLTNAWVASSQDHPKTQYQPFIFEEGAS